MDFLVYGRAAPGAGDREDDPLLDEAHWSYMDAFAGRMTARGPTLTPDRQTWTGSLHVVDLADAEAARAFALDDPYHRAGLFGGHRIWRFDNLLGATMWDVEVPGDGVPFLVLALIDSDGRLPGPTLARRLVMWGTLRSLPEEQPCGVALALTAPDRVTVRSLLANDPALAGWSAHTEVYAWEFGGRR